jgi:hypothetical protein
VPLRLVVFTEVVFEEIGSHIDGYCYLLAVLSIRTHYPSAKSCEVRFS